MAHNQRPPEAFRSPDIFEQGLGYVCVTRFKSGGRAESGVFLVDVYCLGVKDAFFEQSISEVDYEVLLNEILPTGRIEMAPAEARKFVEQAVAYAAHLGLAPAADYKKGARVFGGIHSEEWTGDFTFGKDGKPFFIAGPNDSRERCKKILSVLEAHCGPGNYDYLVPEELADIDEEDETAELEEMARQYEAEHPESEVLVNLPGIPKMSDQLRDLIEPLMDEAVTLPELKALLTMAMLAWNYPMLPSENQEAFWQKTAKLLDPEGIKVLEMLIARRNELFPNDLRFVTEADATEGPAHKFHIRAIYALDLDEQGKARTR